MAKANLAKARRLINANDFGQAEKLCLALVRRKTPDRDAQFLLANLYLSQRRYEESESLYRQILDLHPDNVTALCNLAFIFLEHHQDHLTAFELLQQAISLQPTHVKSLINLSNVCIRIRDFDKARSLCLAAHKLDPTDYAAVNNLGAIASKQQNFEEAAEWYRQAHQIQPDDTSVLHNLTNSIMRRLGRRDTQDLSDDIRELCEKVNALSSPGEAAFGALALAQGYCIWDELEGLRKTVLGAIQSGGCSSQSIQTSVLYLLAAPEISAGELREQHIAAGETLLRTRVRAAFRHTPRASSERLRLGYISPDFRAHVVSTFMRGLFNSYDRTSFEVYCYYTSKNEDHVTEMYRRTVDAFENVFSLSPEALAERIYSDRIDILVDLAGYTTGGGAQALIYKPAPVQMMYLGYPFSSGLSVVDYVVSDPYLDGPRNADAFLEKQLRLPECFITFDSLDEQETASPPPFERNGHVTFGCLNNCYKLSPLVVQTWSRILCAVPGSRLILNHPGYSNLITRQTIWREFERGGVIAERVVFVWETHPSGSHYRWYHDVDIALDVFPLTGGTTTVEALWMGVPVVTLVGDVYHQRMSYSILKNCGTEVDDLIAFDLDDYVRKAAAIAKDVSRISDLRQKIPANLEGSIMRDPERFSRQMEELYRVAWDNWANSTS